MKTINRNNYENFFILYVDDELDALAKLEVEKFVQQHADLEIELEMLMQTKLQPEEFEFDNKESLLRTEGNGINETNYEEYFLLYNDNELSAAKREEVETYILQHPQLQDEFTLLKQTIVLTENISYTNKEDLYKHEKKRVVYLKPLRWVAAAVFIGLLAAGYWMFEKSNISVVTADSGKNQTQHEKQNQSASINQTKRNSITVKAVDSNLNIAPNQIQHQEAMVAQQQAEPAENKSESATSIKEKKNINVKKNKVVVAVQSSSSQKEKPRHIKTSDENIVVQQPRITSNNRNEIIADNNKNQLPATATTSINKKEITETASPKLANNEAGNSTYKTYNVAYKEIVPNDENNSVHVGMLDLNKTKVKGLLKKAGRLFGNKASKNTNEDGKLQVANFEIQTNNL